MEEGNLSHIRLLISIISQCSRHFSQTGATNVDELINELSDMQVTSKSEGSSLGQDSQSSKGSRTSRSSQRSRSSQSSRSSQRSRSSQSVDELIKKIDGAVLDKVKVKRRKHSKGYTSGMKIEPIMPTEANFLNKALVTINPCYAAEPFYAMGIEVIAVTDMKEIYTLEDIPLEEYEPERELQLEIDQELIELKDFLNSTLNMNKDIEASDVSGKRGHFLSQLVSAIVQPDKSGNKEEVSAEWLKLIESKYSKNSLVELMSFKIEQLINNLPNNFSESDLQKFVLKVLNGFKKYDCDFGTKINITQFRHAKDDKTQSQKCTPDLEFYKIPTARMRGPNYCGVRETLMLLFEFKAPTMSTHLTWTPQMHNITRENGMESFKLKSKLLWQHTEAMLGKMMQRITAEGTTKMLQGGILVCNDRIRNLVFCMNTEAHRSMKNNKSARETMNWIFKKNKWARLYVHANEYHILEIIDQSLYTANNFCK